MLARAWTRRLARAVIVLASIAVLIYATVGFHTNLGVGAAAARVVDGRPLRCQQPVRGASRTRPRHWRQIGPTQERHRANFTETGQAPLQLSFLT